jgi:hypothetical protein
VAIVDLPLDAGDDLIGERLPALLADREGEHADSRLAGLARRSHRYSYGI